MNILDIEEIRTKTTLLYTAPLYATLRPELYQILSVCVFLYALIDFKKANMKPMCTVSQSPDSLYLCNKHLNFFLKAEHVQKPSQVYKFVKKGSSTQLHMGNISLQFSSLYICTRKGISTLVRLSW